MTKGTWKPAKRPPMLGNGFRPQLGNPLIIGAARWLIPFLAVSGGTALTSYVVSKNMPQVPINLKNLGLSSALIGGGATAYYVAEALGEKYKPWAYAAAVAGIGSGLYFLFQEPPPAPPTPPSSPTAREEMPKNCKIPGTPRANENQPPSISGIRVDMDLDQDRVGGLKRNKYADQDYAFELRNLSNDPKCFYVGLDIRDDDGKPMTESYNQTFPGGKSPVGPSIYGRQEVFLQPGEYKSMTLKAPGFGSAWMPATSFNMTVAVELFRNLRDQFPFQQSNVIQVNGVPPWIAGLGDSGVQPMQVELHDERNPQHVIGCKKCKRKKKNPQVVGLPYVPLVYPPSDMV